MFNTTVISSSETEKKVSEVSMFSDDNGLEV